MMKKQVPAELWTKILGKMVDFNLTMAQVLIPMDVCKSTFYSNKKEYFNGRVKPRKPGTSAKRTYETKDYEQFLRDLVNSLLLIFGSERIWMEARRLGAPFGQTVCPPYAKGARLAPATGKGPVQETLRTAPG